MGVYPTYSLYNITLVIIYVKSAGPPEVSPVPLALIHRLTPSPLLFLQVSNKIVQYFL